MEKGGDRVFRQAGVPMKILDFWEFSWNKCHGFLIDLFESPKHVCTLLNEFPLGRGALFRVSLT